MNNMACYRSTGNIRVLPDASTNEALYAHSDGYVSGGREVAAIRRKEARDLLPAERSVPRAKYRRSS